MYPNIGAKPDKHTPESWQVYLTIQLGLHGTQNNHTCSKTLSTTRALRKCTGYGRRLLPSLISVASTNMSKKLPTRNIQCFFSYLCDCVDVVLAMQRHNPLLLLEGKTGAFVGDFKDTKRPFTSILFHFLSLEPQTRQVLYKIGK